MFARLFPRAAIKKNDLRLVPKQPPWSSDHETQASSTPSKEDTTTERDQRNLMIFISLHAGSEHVACVLWVKLNSLSPASVSTEI